MRFLEDHELPEPERSRRETIRSQIQMLQAHIASEWKHIEPELVRAVREGRYEAEQELRRRTHRRCDVMRSEIARMLELLPPIMEMRADGHFEMVAAKR